MSCRFYAEKGGEDWCTSKGGYIPFYCPSDDRSCRYYIDSDDVKDCDCPYWSSGNYCSAKGGYVSGNCSYGYTSCRYYREANGGSSDDGGSGGCYLTTACVWYKDRPDDCVELQILRNYRDTYLKSFEEGRKDVKEYYRVAPAIIVGIRKQPDVDEIWEDIYTNLVCKCIELINAGKYSEAHYHYKDFTLKLMKYID